jgi:hypothetical protein
MSEARSAAIGTIGRCIGALVMKEPDAGVEPSTKSNAQIRDNQVSWLSAIFDVRIDDVQFFLECPGATEIAAMVSFIFTDVGSVDVSAFPLDVREATQQTFAILSQTANEHLDQSIAKVDLSDAKFDRIIVSGFHNLLQMCLPGSSTLTANVRRGCLRTCLKSLWCFAIACDQLDASKSILSYFPSTAIASLIPEVIHLIQTEQDLASRVMGRCFCALVVMKLVASISSRIDSNASNDELAWLSATLGIQSDDVKLCLECPGAIELANIASLEMGDVSPSMLFSRTASYVNNMANRTVRILSEALPAEKATGLQSFTSINSVDEKLVDVIASCFHDLLQSKTSLLTAAVRRSHLRVCLKSLWYCAKAYHQPDAVETLLQYSLNTLASPGTIRRIQTIQDPISRVMGCCFSALIIVKLVADIRSCINSDVEIKLEWLSAILGPNGDDMKIPLQWSGAVELASLVCLTSLADVSGVGSEPLDVNALPSYLFDVAQETFDILSRAAKLKLDHPTAPLIGLDEKFGRVVASHLCSLLKKGIPNTSSSMEGVRRSCVRMCLKILWYCAKEHHQLGASRPLPSYFPSTLASPEMIHLFQDEQDAEAGVMERCFGTLVAVKLVADLRTRTDSDSSIQISGDELACLSAILGTESRNLKNWLGQPGAVELASLFSLTLSEVDALFANKALDVLDDMVQQTSTILTRTLPAEFNIELMDLTDGQCEAILLSCLRDCRSESCLSGTSSPTEPIYESRVRVYLKNLWHCARACNQLGISVHLPSFVRIILAYPEFTRRIHTERDLATRVSGRCACALIVNKLVDDFRSRISFGNGVYNEELACISSLLGTAPGNFSRWPRPSAVIKLQNIVTLVSGEIEALLSSEQTPTDTLPTVQQTLDIICSDLVFGGVLAVGELPMDQVSLLREICSRIANARPANLFIMDETTEILGQLQQISKQLPTAEHKMRRCASSVFDPRSVRGRGNLTTRPDYEVRRRRSKSM